MELMNYVIWVIVVPLLLAFFGVRQLKIRAWIIFSFEVLIILLLTFVDIIENYPIGSLQRQLTSYFGNITNNFYLKYIPFIILSVIFVKFLKKPYNPK
jgi:hypothetical protein